MKIVYLICAHTDSVHINRLINALSHNKNTGFVVHLDKKSAIEIENIKKPSNAAELIVLKSINVNWGGYSQCEAIIQLINAAMSSYIKYDRFVYISGQDYPLWSNERIQSFFQINKDKEYIMALNLSELKSPRKMPERIKAYHFFRDCNITYPPIKRLICGGFRRLSRLFFFANRNHFCGLPIYEGSSWWALSRECLLYVLDYYKSEGIKIKQYFKYTFAPDEMMIHTLVFNSPYRNKAILYDKCIYPGLVGLTPLHYIEYSGAIAIFTEKDKDKLITSDKMFCRKVKTEVSDKLMDIIDNYRNEKVED